MKISSFLATGLGVFLLAGAANAATTTYTAKLTGAQSLNPSFTSTATAEGSFNYDDVTKSLTGTVVYHGFTILPSGAQVRTGACAEQGDIVFSVTTLSDGATAEDGVISFNATTALEPDQITGLLAGNLYVGISNTTYPAPETEIRGQIIADGTANDECASVIGAVDAGTDSGNVIAPAPDGGTTTEPTTTTTVDDSGCNTTGGSSSPGSSTALALGLGLALYGISRKRKQA